MSLSYLLMTPFTWLLETFYNLMGNYGMALILFTLVTRLILFPFSLKGKKSMIKMNMLSGQMQRLQKQYANNPTKYNEALQDLYTKENVNPMGGCLWSMLPMLFIFPLFAIIRQPLKYLMGVVGPDADAMFQAIAKTVNWENVAVEMGWIKEAAPFSNTVYNQMYLSSLITPENLEAVKTAVAAVGEPAKALFAMNYKFLGVNLMQQPTLKFWVNGMSWGSIGLFLLPVVSAGISGLMSYVSQKTNNISGERNEQTETTNKVMMLISPLMFLWFGFRMPAAMSIYFMASSLFGIAQEFICGQLLKGDYEKAREEQKRRAQEEKEEEKRLRREKAEERARQAEEARKNKGKKKPKAEEDDDGRTTPEQREASRVGMRQYARGRAYEPDRFGGVTPYDEKAVEALFTLAAQPEKKKKSRKDSGDDK